MRINNRIIMYVSCLWLACWFAGCGANDATERKTASTEAAAATNVSDQSSQGKVASDSTRCTVDFSAAQLPDACRTNGQYQAVFINGTKSGYALSGRLVRGATVESCEFSQLIMKRGALEMSITNVTKMVETTAGKPLVWAMISEGAGMKKESCGVVSGSKAYVSTFTAGKETRKEIEWEEGTLMQEGLRIFMKTQSMDKGTRAHAKGFDVEGESVMDLDYLVQGEEEVDLLGKVTSGIRIDTTVTRGTSSMASTEWLNDDLETLKSSSSVMGMTIETILCEKDFALQQNNPAEIFTASFIDSPRVLHRKELAQGVAYSIEPLADQELMFPQAPEQQVVPMDNGAIEIRVSPKKIPVGGVFPYRGSDAELVGHTSPNAWIQSDHGSVVALAKQAVGDETDAGRAAKKIEAFVAGYINNRSLSVGYASALEVLNSRQGDCTEFALLTVALCRALGIPARVVFGVVYVSDEFEGHRNFFGGHAWAQVNVKDGWYSLDAAMGGFNAGHVAIDYNDGEPSNFFKLITTMGYFDIADVNPL